LNAGTHFPAETLPYDIGYKCLAVNLSDMAAMGAIPRWVLLSLSLPHADPEWVHSFIAGFNLLAKTHDVSLVGGDTTSGSLSVSMTALGTVKPGMQLLRSGANPGDLLVVSGTIGGAARVLDLLKTGQAVRQRQLLNRPQPQVKLGRSLPGYASACIDVSDGLLADLGHITEASHCGARLEIEKLPQSRVLAGLDDELKWNYQLSGGDDYELLFSLPRRHEGLIADWSQLLDINLSVIGEIEKHAGIRCLTADGVEYNPEGAGFEHFSPEL